MAKTSVRSEQVTDDTLVDADVNASAAIKKTKLVDVVVALSDGANIATDVSLGNTFTVTLGGNRTLDNPTNPVDGMRVIWRFKQDGTGTRTITLGSVFRLGTDITAVVLTTTAAKTDYMGAIYNATDTKWDVIAFLKGY